MIEEAESGSLESYLAGEEAMTVSRIALVEVRRATALANPSTDAIEETEHMLATCLLVDVSDRVLREAAALTSLTVRTLDAIHLATALYTGADEVVAYDRRLLEAAEGQGLGTASPGAG